MFPFLNGCEGRVPFTNGNFSFLNEEKPCIFPFDNGVVTVGQIVTVILKNFPYNNGESCENNRICLGE